LSQVFVGQNVGIKEVADKTWLLSFMHYDLGFFDQEAGRVECAKNRLETQVLPTHVSGINRYPYVQNGPR
jgi:hypothetical protein